MISLMGMGREARIPTKGSQVSLVCCLAVARCGGKHAPRLYYP